MLAAFSRHDLDPNPGVLEWTVSGTTVDGDRIEVGGCDLWRFDEEGRLNRKDSFWKLRET